MGPNNDMYLDETRQVVNSEWKAAVTYSKRRLSPSIQSECLPVCVGVR